MNRPRFPEVDEVRQLVRHLSMTVPPDWQDRNGHVNVQYYLRLYELGGYEMLEEVGLNENYSAQSEYGLFDFEHHLNFRAELHVGDQVSTYNRIIATHHKRIQGMYFIINDTREQLACTIEYISACVNLQTRRTMAFPEILHDGFMQLTQKHQALSWPAPVCGAMTI